MSLAEYQALDLGADGAIARDLAARLEGEAQQPIIPLSGPHGASAESPAFLTSAMLAWYQSHVASARQTALALARAGFEAQPMPSGNKGFLAEAEADLIERRKQDHLRGERESFFQQKSVRDMAAEIERLRSEYERKRSEHGRDARAWRPVWYYGGLFLVAASEYPVNLAAFLKIPFLTPAFATATVTAIAFGFAFSGHLIGMVIRQWSERFGDDVTGRLKGDSVRLLGIGLLLLAIGAAAIVFSRSYLVAEAIAREESLGQESSGSIVSIYGLAFITNVIVYVIGMAWSIVFHDPIPDFSEERDRLSVLDRRLRRRYEAQLEKKQRQRVEEGSRALAQLARREADQAKNLPNHGAHRARFEEVRKLDAKTLSLLETYRSRLVAAAAKQGVQTRFVYEDLSSGNIETTRSLDRDGYLRQRLHLGYA